MFSDDSYIYLTDTKAPAEYATEAGPDSNPDTVDESSQTGTTTVSVLDYNGKLIRTFETNSNIVDDVFTIGDSTYVLDNNGLQKSTDGSDAQQIPFFESVETALGVNGSVVYVDSTGVWGVGDSSIKYLLYGFAEGETGVDSSLSILNDALVFGASGKKAGSNSLGQTYSIKLSQLQ